MDVIEAIHSRRSVRAFKPDPVPREVLQSIMEAALQAPSWENTQPWEFAVLGGDVMKNVKEALAAMGQAGEKPQLELPLAEVHRSLYGSPEGGWQALGAGTGTPEGRPGCHATMADVHEDVL